MSGEEGPVWEPLRLETVLPQPRSHRQRFFGNSLANDKLSRHKPAKPIKDLERPGLILIMIMNRPIVITPCVHTHFL
jgi:hypothetical protein